ncbi:hypothetical protein [Marinilabilia salmonicolor]|uniref:hypothetical protein n=1 Tax=Marinilabilia salmonicolor TaxID=989 RepID=UPI00029B40D3|nr:hypothetical protein [Marinilabilia salmonicolor]
MKVLNKQEIKAVAADVFKRYKKAQKVAVTTDGMAFITDEGDNAVKNHAIKNRYKKELKIHSFTRDDFDSAKSPKVETAENLIAAINEAETATTVEHILAAEEQGKKRKSVLEAAEARIKELKTD